MSELIASVAGDGVRAAIRRGADAAGVDFTLLVETARRESAFNPQARAGTSSATGLFQFVESTWLDVVRRHGAAHGLGAQAAALTQGADAETRRGILALRTDAEISARMAGELARENAAALRTRLGRAPSAGELYAAHVLGAGGAARLIEAAAQGAPDAAALFPREAAANAGLFYSDGRARSAQSLLARLDLDAGASGAAAPRAPGAEPSGALSPALAQVLFAIALAPFANEAEERRADPFRALSAYARQVNSSGGA